MDNTYSIQLRLKRTIVEDTYVSVPVSNLIMKEKEDGNLGIDFEKFTKEGIRISKNYEVDWQVESSTIEVHPIQAVRPEERKSFDPYGDENYWKGELKKVTNYRYK